MSKNQSIGDFIQPVISTLGLAISLLATLLPLFTKGIIANLFLNKNLAMLSSFLAFLIGFAVIWQIIGFQPFIQINLGKYKSRGEEFPTYWKTIGPNGVVWFLLFIAVALGYLFFFLGIKFSGTTDSLLQTAQALFYIIFFLSLISVFAVLFSQTKQRFNWQADRENFPTTIFETLEKNRLIKPYIEIYENRPMNFEELRNEGVTGVPIAKKMRVKT